MTKLQGKYCPKCNLSTKCFDRCNWCWEELVNPWPDFYTPHGIRTRNRNPRTGKKMPIEKETGRRHYGCMKHPPADPEVQYVDSGKVINQDWAIDQY